MVLMVVVAMLAPLMYSLSFMKSVWDPYGGASELPVAVVNNDQATEYQGHVLKVGDQTVDQLKKNHQLKWQFVSAQIAKEGMKNHRYYTVVTIPKNFSQNAATVMDKHPRKMELKYQTNDSKNYLAETMSEIGMGRLNSQIRSSVTNAYATAVFQNLKVLDKGMNTAANGAHQLSSGLATMQDGTNRYTIGVSKVNDGVQTLKVKVTPLTAIAQQLASGSQRLAEGLQTYTGGVYRLGSGLNLLNNKSGQLTSGSQQLQQGLTTLSGNSKDLRDGSQQLADSTDMLDAVVGPTIDSLDLNGIMSTMDKAQQLKGSLANLQQGLGQAQTALGAVSASAGKLNNAAKTMGDASSQLGKLTGVAQTDGQIAASDAGIAQQAAQLAQTTTDNNSKAALSQIAKQAGQNANAAKGNAVTIAGMSGTLKDMQALQGQLGTMQTQLGKFSQMQGVLSNANTTMTQANQLMSQLDGYRDRLSGMSGMTDVLTSAISQLSDGASQLNGGLNRYTRGVDSAAAGSNQLNIGLNQYANGVATATAGAAQLNSNSGQLNSGAGQLASALGQLNGQVPALVGGVDQLAAGTQQLVANSPALIGGVNLLNAGAGRLALVLGNGVQQLNQQQPGKSTAKMFATPSMLKHDRYSRVPNYGHALAPFIMATGLFIGVLIFTLEFPSSRILDSDRNRLQMLLHELAVAVITSLLMVIVQNGGLVLAGLHVQHPLQLFWIGFSYTLAQMAIMQCFTIILGRFGTILGLLLFVAQLGGAGGMFPMEVTNRFFNIIHPWLPMTYAVNGFRQGITGGFGGGYITNNALVLWGFALAFYLILLLVAHPLQLRMQRRKQAATAEA